MRTVSGANLRSGSVTVDRTWAQALGIDQLPGARRTGKFYQVPRSRLLQLESFSPTLKWTEKDDRAVAAMLAQSGQQTEVEPCLDCTG